MRGNDFAAKRGAAAEIGAEQPAPAVGRVIRPGLALGRPAVAQGETDAVADETHEAFTGRGCHG